MIRLHSRSMKIAIFMSRSFVEIEKLTTHMGIASYLVETRGELKHVSWPSRRQTILFTVLVLVVSLVVAAYLGILDFLFSRLLELLISSVA